MFHVELRKFPHVAREFNLSEEDLRTRILVPWVRGAPVELQERSFTSDRARLTIYEGPAVAAEERGLGRGWSAVTRDGEDVTTRLTEGVRQLVPRAAEAKSKMMAATPISLSRAVSLVREGHPGCRPSEYLAVAEQAVWELLHEGRIAIVRGGSEVSVDEWESILLAWEQWVDSGASVVLELRDYDRLPDDSVRH